MSSRVVARIVASAASQVFRNGAVKTSGIRAVSTVFPGSNFNRANSWTSPSILKQQFRAFAEEPINVPSLGDSISEAGVSTWFKEVGDAVEVDDVLVQLETDKTTVDIRAQSAGVLRQILAKEGDTVEVGNQLAVIDVGATDGRVAESAKEEPAKSEEPKPAPADATPAPVPAPAAPAPAEPAATPAAASKPASKPAPTQAPAAPQARGERRVPMSRMRLKISSRLKDSQNTAAALTTFNEIDMSNLMQLRKEYKDVFEKKHGVKFGFMSAFVKACTISLLENPAVNAVIDGNDIVYRDYVDVSVAVATPTGLIVPVLRDCDKKSLAEIELALADLGRRGREGQIAVEEMMGGTFTISNGGVFGSLFGTPIINQPQSGILGMHAIKDRPVAVDGKVEIRPMMYIALTYDHRIIDGREGVTFLKTVKEQVEDPRRMLLGV